MSYPPDDFDRPAAPPAGAARARDRGVARIRGLTRWIAVAAVAGAAALGTVYTHVLPGSSASPASPGPAAHNPVVPSSSPAARSSGGDDEGGEEGDDGGTRPALQVPAQPPTPTQQQPQATTGAS
ncbi:hypothetical protein ABZ848_48705 [Streptomyces sp. NPDC047081]|uniref:hypothetical protein n=1 Tax=Streptomyces sp. NPDC047081 TaxID=3154706 RepID=UPI00340F1C05